MTQKGWDAIKQRKNLMDGSPMLSEITIWYTHLNLKVQKKAGD